MICGYFAKNGRHCTALDGHCYVCQPKRGPIKAAMDPDEQDYWDQLINNVEQS